LQDQKILQKIKPIFQQSREPTAVRVFTPPCPIQRCATDFATRGVDTILAIGWLAAFDEILILADAAKKQLAA
jgi:hypothetical protein